MFSHLLIWMLLSTQRNNESEIYFITAKAVPHIHLQVITRVYVLANVCRTTAAQVSVEIGKVFNKNFLSLPRHTRANMNVIFHHVARIEEEEALHDYAFNV